MNREFLTNIIFLISINILIKPFYLFGIDRTIQNVLPSGEYGLYFTLFSFTYLFQIINDFGIQNYNNRNIAQHRHLLDKYFSNVLMLKFLLGLLYLGVILAATLISNFERSYYHLILIIAVNHLITSLVLFLRSNISGLGFYRLDSLLSVTDKLLLILICSILLWSPAYRGQFRIEWLIYAQTFTLSLTALLAFSIVYSRIKTFNFRLRPRLLLVILKQSWPYALVIFLMTVYTRIDAVMVERLLPDGILEADLYASAYRLLDASNMIGVLFAVLLLPMFSRMLKERQAVNHLVGFSFQIIWAGALTLAIATFFFREEIMVFLYTDGTAYSGQILGYLMISFVAISGSYIYGTLLTANGSMKMMNFVFAGGVVVNVLLNLLLIPKYKALGAAMATCVTQFLVFFAQVLLAWRLLPLSIAPGMILRLFLFILFNIGCIWQISQLEGLDWGVKFFACVLAGVPLAFLFKLLSLKNLFSLIKPA